MMHDLYFSHVFETHHDISLRIEMGYDFSEFVFLFSTGSLDQMQGSYIPTHRVACC